MNTFMKMFADSAKEFKNLRSVVTAALFVALHTILALFLSIQVTASVRISLSFIANIMIGCMFGPVMGFVCGGIGDLIQFIIKPTGPYFIGWTISAALAGLIYGCFFYRKLPTKIVKTEKRKSNHGEASKSRHDQRAEFFVQIVCSVLSLFALSLLVIAPFAQVTAKDTGAVILEGSAMQVIIRGMSAEGGTNIVILAVMSTLISLFLLVTPWLKLHGIPMAAAIICAFLNILSVYTDKKTTTTMWGFWIVMLLLVLYGVIQMIYMAKKHSIDLSFMLRCVIALTFDTVLINILLGTYWVQFMYGKGFAFYLTTRLVKNLVQLPINIILTYYVLGLLRRLRIKDL